VKVSKERLKRVIKEEIAAVLSEKQAVKTEREKRKTRDRREREEMLRARKRGMMGGQLQSMANGIMEEDDPIEEDNPYHKEDGTFAGEGDATCISTYFKDGKRERVGGSISHPKSQVGRGPHRNKGTGRVRCKNPKATELKWESLVEPNGKGQSVRISKDALERLIGETLQKLLESYLETADEEHQEEPIEESSGKEQFMEKCKRMGLRSLKDFLVLQNNMEASAKGNLFKQTKKG